MINKEEGIGWLDLAKRIEQLKDDLCEASIELAGKTDWMVDVMSNRIDQLFPETIDKETGETYTVNEN